MWLLLQALISSLLHIKYIQFGFSEGSLLFLVISPFLISLVLGILYEIAGTIYPSVICHGLFNYLLLVLRVL